MQERRHEIAHPFPITKPPGPVQTTQGQRKCRHTPNPRLFTMLYISRGMVDDPNLLTVGYPPPYGVEVLPWRERPCLHFHSHQNRFPEIRQTSRSEVMKS